MIVVLLGDSMVELNNSYGVIEFILSVLFELLIDTNQIYQVQFRSLPKLFLQKFTLLWVPSAGVLQLVPWWAHISFFQQQWYIPLDTWPPQPPCQFP